MGYRCSHRACAPTTAVSGCGRSLLSGTRVLSAAASHRERMGRRGRGRAPGLVLRSEDRGNGQRLGTRRISGARDPSSSSPCLECQSAWLPTLLPQSQPDDYRARGSNWCSRSSAGCSSRIRQNDVSRLERKAKRVHFVNSSAVARTRFRWMSRVRNGRAIEVASPTEVSSARVGRGPCGCSWAAWSRHCGSAVAAVLAFGCACLNERVVLARA